MIEYRETKAFTATELEELFLSVGWLSGSYPLRLEKAINHSDTVISAWDGNQLAGLINALDDGELTAYAHYLLVNPKYHGLGIGKELVARLKNKYEGYLYLILIAEEKKNIAFYEQYGFKVVEGATPLSITTL
jgi:ribosomal protein S18 acetylase RimI-like enzyme